MRGTVGLLFPENFQPKKRHLYSKNLERSFLIIQFLRRRAKAFGNVKRGDLWKMGKGSIFAESKGFFPLRSFLQENEP